MTNQNLTKTTTEIEVGVENKKDTPQFDPFLNPYLNYPTPMELPKATDKDDIYKTKEHHNRKAFERNLNEEIKNTQEFQNWQRQNERIQP